MHDGGQRLCEAADGGVSREPRPRSRSRRVRLPAVPDDLGRGHDHPRHRDGVPRPAGRVGAERRGHPRRPRRPLARLRPGAVVRYGRDDGEDLPHRGGGAADLAGVRGRAGGALHQGQRAAGADPGAGDDRDRGRWRLHRERGRAFAAAGGAAQRVFGPRTGLLRARRRVGDGDRCGRGGGVSGPRGLRRRAVAARSRPCPPRGRARGRRQASDRCGGRGGRHLADGGRGDGQRGADARGGAGEEPWGLRDGGVRGERAAARDAGGGEGGGGPDRGAAAAGGGVRGGVPVGAGVVRGSAQPLRTGGDAGGARPPGARTVRPLRPDGGARRGGGERAARCDAGGGHGGGAGPARAMRLWS